MATEWVRRRMIVELPVRGDVNDADMRFLIETALQAGRLEERLRERHPGAQTGRLDVKSFSRVVSAFSRADS